MQIEFNSAESIVLLAAVADYKQNFKDSEIDVVLATDLEKRIHDEILRFYKEQNDIGGFNDG